MYTVGRNDQGRFQVFRWTSLYGWEVLWPRVSWRTIDQALYFGINSDTPASEIITEETTEEQRQVMDRTYRVFEERDYRTVTHHPT